MSEVFSDLCIASRTVSKCDKLADELKDKTSTNITTAKVDADNTDEVIALINEFKPDVVLNVALPYQDLTIMDACLACKVPYVDTANYECEDTDNPEWRKVYEERCKRLGFTAYSDNTQGSGKAIQPRNVTVGIFDKYPCNADKGDNEYNCQWKVTFPRSVHDREVFGATGGWLVCRPALLFPVSPHPEKPTVDSGYQIIDIDAKVGIQSRLVIYKDVNGRHDDTCYPKIDTSPVFQPKVD